MARDRPLDVRALARRAGLVAQSAALRSIVRQLGRIAPAESNVLITGESGVGKDAVAAALHRAGPRRSAPFLKIDCPSLPESLFESELFGHEKGAFTGADAARAGKLELAAGGTMYLDGVDDLSLAIQAKLLRVVEEKRFERVGGNESRRLQARVVASAGAGLEDTVRSGAFRSDLYHRLRVLPIEIPPLRERTADIIPLARHFLREAKRRFRRRALRFSPAAFRALVAYPWPGNARELRHCVDRAALAVPGTVIDEEHLPAEILDSPHAYFRLGAARRPTLAEVERRYIELTLRHTNGSQTRAAAILGISRKALWEKRKRYKLL